MCAAAIVAAAAIADFFSVSSFSAPLLLRGFSSAPLLALPPRNLVVAAAPLRVRMANPLSRDHQRHEQQHEPIEVIRPCHQQKIMHREVPFARSASGCGRRPNLKQTCGIVNRSDIYIIYGGPFAANKYSPDTLFPIQLKLDTESSSAGVMASRALPLAHQCAGDAGNSGRLPAEPMLTIQDRL